MKYVLAIVLAFCFFLNSIPLKAQTAKDSVLLVADQMPEYPGGMDSLNKVIATKLIYPKQCADSGIQGKVFIRFVVNENGAISHVEAIKGPHPLLNSAAVTAVKTLGKFNPGMEKGRPVKVYFNMPVAFRIGSDEKNSLFDFYPGGYPAFDTLIDNNIRYPVKAREKGVEAVITVVCKLNTQLKLLPEKVENSLDTTFDNEAIRLVKLMKPFDEKIKQSPYASAGLFIKVHFDLPFKGNLKNYYAYRKTNTEYYDLGVKYFKQNNYAKALEYFDAAIQLYPRDAEAYFNRGITQTKLNNNTSACDDFKRAYLLGLLDAKKGIEQDCK